MRPLAQILLLVWSAVMLFVSLPTLHLMTVATPPDWKWMLWACGALSLASVLVPVKALARIRARRSVEQKEREAANLLALGLILPVLFQAFQLYLLWDRAVLPMMKA